MRLYYVIDKAAQRKHRLDFFLAANLGEITEHLSLISLSKNGDNSTYS